MTKFKETPTLNINNLILKIRKLQKQDNHKVCFKTKLHVCDSFFCKYWFECNGDYDNDEFLKNYPTYKSLDLFDDIDF